MLSEDTKQLMARDIAVWRERRTEKQLAIADLLDDLEPQEVKSIISGILTGGYKRRDGAFRSAQEWNYNY